MSSKNDIRFTKKNIKYLIFTRSSDSVSTVLDGETVILDIEKGTYSGTNIVGSSIWELLENPISLSSIIEKIVTLYDVEEKQCTIDIIDFLKHLNDAGLLVMKYGKNT